MREERGRVYGDVIIYERYTLWGTIIGMVRVIEKGKFWVRGNIQGDMTVEYGGRVHIYGNVTGDLFVARGAKVIVTGTVGGSATNDGGRLYIDPEGRVLGKIKTQRGETVQKDNLVEPDNPYVPKRKRPS
jgi:hypothetical protein